jgi:hypothetical protein
MRARALRHLALITTTALAALLLVGASGCGGTSPTGGCNAQGILWLSWTVRGKAVSDNSCSGIDHLILEMRTSTCGTIEIEPIPCLRGLGWEYDNLPEGDNTVVIEAVDIHSHVLLQGSSDVVVTSLKPASTTQVALQ